MLEYYFTEAGNPNLVSCFTYIHAFIFRDPFLLFLIFLPYSSQLEHCLQLGIPRIFDHCYFWLTTLMRIHIHCNIMLVSYEDKDDLFKKNYFIEGPSCAK